MIEVNPQMMVAGLIMMAVFATIVAIMYPMLQGDKLGKRMKSVATERQAIRARGRAAQAAGLGSASLREKKGGGAASLAERFDLRARLDDGMSTARLRRAGMRGQNALNSFFAFKLIGPVALMAFAAFYIFVLGILADQPLGLRIAIVFGAAGLGFYLPNIYVSNLVQKRQKSIVRAWPDALDLTLICVESGMSIEASFRKVSEEIGMQSVELAEELTLTVAELSYLPERRQAYENLVTRTGIDAVKAVTQALQQAERYGTPVGQALRVLAQESRAERMTAAEKKAHALPPKLTVPMIVFFVPVLFIVVLGPGIMSALENF